MYDGAGSLTRLLAKLCQRRGVGSLSCERLERKHPANFPFKNSERTCPATARSTVAWYWLGSGEKGCLMFELFTHATRG